MNNVLVVAASDPLATPEYHSVKRNKIEKLLSMQNYPGIPYNKAT